MASEVCEGDDGRCTLYAVGYGMEEFMFCELDVM